LIVSEFTAFYNVAPPKFQSAGIILSNIQNISKSLFLVQYKERYKRFHLINKNFTI